MANTPKIGRIYHVIDKITGEVVKVGSTIRSLKQRFSHADYKKKYTNHFLKEVRIIESSEFDWYDKKDPYCPFLWHLVAAEHLEILKQDTFRKSPLSNWRSPLDQKAAGLDGVIGGAIGGIIAGRMAAESGQLEKARNSPQALEARKKLLENRHMDWVRNLPQTKEAQSKNGSIIGKRNSETGQIQELGRKNKGSLALIARGKIQAAKYFTGLSKEALSNRSKGAGKKAKETGQIHKLGRAQGRKNADSGLLANIALLGAHTRCHINKGIVNPNCPLCKPL